ncbi:MAG: cytochrome C peroxidase [Candidatus Accumulibacter sp.]|nr:cytochrome C peroxidase [Accumulibacter sp.]
MKTKSATTLSRNPVARAVVSAGLMAAALGSPLPAAAACSPCAARSRSGRVANPCAAKNPCATKNPCTARAPCAARALTRPANYQPYMGDEAELIKAGEALFKDTRLSTNGMSCNSCHQNYGAFQASFAEPYPHAVRMATNAGISQVHLDEFVQFCVVNPLAAKPLPWDSRELAALTAYVADLQKGFKPRAAKANPCAARGGGY